MSITRRATRLLALLAGLGLALLCACATTGSPASSPEGSAPSSVPAAPPSPARPGEAGPAWEAVPEGYESPATVAGTLVPFDYTSTSPASGGGTRQKSALVYLPPDFDPDDPTTAYNVLYLMHGYEGSQFSWMGKPKHPTPLPSILDHAIAEGQIRPVIIVMPTYEYVDLDPPVADFYRELVDDLVPAVESAYPTHAESVDAAGLRASREHRAFGGFSLGGVTTWHVLEHGTDIFADFLPMGGDSWTVATWGGLYSPKDTAASLAHAITSAGFGPNDFHVLAASGSEDFTTPYMDRQIAAMTAHPQAFVLADDDDFSHGNLVYHVVPGSEHDYPWAYEYVYNGLRMLPALRIDPALR